MRRVVVLLLLGVIVGCDASGTAPSGPTPPPIPSGDHLATAPVSPPPEVGADAPPLDAFPPLPSPAADGTQTTPPDDGAAGFSNQHGGWPQHGPGGVACWAYGVQLISSMERWPGYVGSFTVTTGGTSKTYLAEWLWYQGVIGYLDANNRMQYKYGVALGAYGELKATSTETYAWIDNKWQHTAMLGHSQSGYYGYGSNVASTPSGTFWTWIHHVWGPIREGTPERPGNQVFPGADHWDYAGAFTC